VTGLQAQLDAIGTLLLSNDTTLDQLQEIVDFIKINRADLDALSIAGVAGLQSALDQKVDKVAGKQLSTEDYSSVEKTKLAGIATGATKNATDAQLRNRATHTGTQTLSTISDAGTAAAADVITSPEDTTSGRVLTVGASPTILSVDPLRKAVESESGGRQTVIYTAKGEPCIMYVLPRFNMEDIPGWTAGTGTHPAFMFNGVAATEIFIGVHEASELNGEAVSQAGRVPWVGINYDNARAACQANGAGWDLMSIWDWAAVALWCMANGFEPRGNTNHGRHHDSKWETGVRQDGATYAPGDSSGIGNILTGSGPNTWRHDNSPAGISDLVGNVWEWLYGMKILDGVVQLAPDSGDYTEAQYTNTGFTLPSARTWSTIDATGAPDSLKQALIVPNGVADPTGYQYINLTGERLPFRGGARDTAGTAGLAAVNLSYGRTIAYSALGFRPRFRNP